MIKSPLPKAVERSESLKARDIKGISNQPMFPGVLGDLAARIVEEAGRLSFITPR